MGSASVPETTTGCPCGSSETYVISRLSAALGSAAAELNGATVSNAPGAGGPERESGPGEQPVASSTVATSTPPMTRRANAGGA